MSIATATVVRSTGSAFAAVAVGIVVAIACYSVGPVAAVLGPAAVAFLVLCATRPHLALFTAPLFAPFENFQLPVAGLGGLSPVEAAMLSIAAGWIWRAVSGGAVVYPRGRDWPIVVLLLSLLPGLAFGSDAIVIARIFVMWLAFYVAYLVAQELDPQQMKGVLVAYAVGAAFLGVEGVSNYVSGGGATLLEGGATVYGRASGAIADPNYFAAFLQLATVPALAFVVGGSSRFRWLLLAPIVAATAGVVLSLSRGGILGLAAAVSLVVLGWARSRLFALALLSVLVAATLTGLNPFANARVSEAVSERLSSVTTHSSDNHRFLLWGAAVNIVETHPLFGIGANGFEAEANRRGLTERGQPLENVHNAYLNVAAELGLLGATGLIVWLVRIGRNLLVVLRRRLDDTYALAVGLGAALVGYCVQALTVSQYRVEIIQATFFLFAGMVAALARQSAEEAPVA